MRRLWPILLILLLGLAACASKPQVVYRTLKASLATMSSAQLQTFDPRAEELWAPAEEAQS